MVFSDTKIQGVILDMFLPDVGSRLLWKLFHLADKKLEKVNYNSFD